MELIKEEDDKELKKFERESIQLQHKPSSESINEIKNESESSDNFSNSNDPKPSREQERYTRISDAIFNTIESCQKENENDNLNETEIDKLQIDNFYTNNGENKDTKEEKKEGNNDQRERAESLSFLPNFKKETTIKEYKVIMLGDYGVGKSSMIHRYIHNKFKKDKDNNTENSENFKKIIQIDEFSKIRLDIWDTAGQEKGGKMFKQYYKDIYGAFLMIDLTNKESFNNIEKWLKELKENSPRDIVYIFIGNKSDLIEERQIMYEDIKDFAQDDLYYEVSSKSGNNISLAFESLAYNIMKKQEDEENNPDRELRGPESRKTSNLIKIKKTNQHRRRWC